MSALQFIGRLLFVIIFIGSGVEKITQTAKHAGYLNHVYPSFHNWVQTNYGTLIPIPQCVSPSAIQKDSTLIIQATGGFLIACSLFILFNIKFLKSLGALGLSTFLVATILIFHNPYNTNNREEYVKQSYAMLYNVALVGVSLILGFTSSNS
jgi:uncharacterized membrane protein YphA (DoxX/SURF4 family)